MAWLPDSILGHVGNFSGAPRQSTSQCGCLAIGCFVSSAGRLSGQGCEFCRPRQCRVYRVSHVDGALFNSTYAETNWLWGLCEVFTTKVLPFCGSVDVWRDRNTKKSCLNCNTGTEPEKQSNVSSCPTFLQIVLVFFLTTSGPLPSVFACLSGPFLLSLETKKQNKKKKTGSVV